MTVADRETLFISPVHSHNCVFLLCESFIKHLVGWAPQTADKIASPGRSPSLTRRRHATVEMYTGVFGTKWNQLQQGEEGQAGSLRRQAAGEGLYPDEDVPGWSTAELESISSHRTFRSPLILVRPGQKCKLWSTGHLQGITSVASTEACRSPFPFGMDKQLSLLLWLLPGTCVAPPLDILPVTDKQHELKRNFCCLPYLSLFIWCNLAPGFSKCEPRTGSICFT